MDRYNTVLCFISIEKVKIMDQNRVYFFDTTLRDGEQTPGVSLQTPEKIEIAKGLVRLGIDVIEAGFPAASPGDFGSSTNDCTRSERRNNLCVGTC